MKCWAKWAPFLQLDNIAYFQVIVQCHACHQSSCTICNVLHAGRRGADQDFWAQFDEGGILEMIQKILKWVTTAKPDWFPLILRIL